jgi:hypothetical protein
MTDERTGALGPAHPFLALLDALEGEIAALAEVLDEETAAALAGRSERLQAC